MLERLLAAMAGLVLRRPGLVVATAVLAAGALTSLVGFARFDLSFGGLMNREHPEVRRYFAASQAYGLGGRLLLLLEGPESELDAALEGLAEGLEPHPEVRSVTGAPPRSWLGEQLPWLVDRPLFDRWTQWVGAPEIDALPALQASLSAAAAARQSARVEGARVAVVTLTRDSFDADLDAQAFPEIDRRTRELLAPRGVRGRYAGMPAIVHQDQEAALGRIRWLTPLSLALVLLLLWRFEARPLGLAAIAAPMLLAAGATLGCVGAVTGTLTLMESLFGVVIFGLGVDIALHLGLRMRDERAGGADFDAALARSLRGTGAAIVAGALTSAGAFFIVSTAPEPTFFHLGLSGGLGIVACLVLMLSLLPATWVLLGRKAPRAGGGDGRPFTTRVLERVVASAVARPGLHLAGAAILAGFAASGLPQLAYESDLRRLVSHDLDAIAAAEQIHARFGSDPGPWVAAADDVESARRLAQRFEADPLFARVESIASLVPADLAERQDRLAGMAPELAALLAAPDTGSGLRGLVAPLAAAAAQGPPTRDSLPSALAQRLLTPDGRWLVQAFATEPSMDARRAREERLAARAVDPDATSINVLFEVLIGGGRPWFSTVFAAVVLFIAAILWLDLRRPLLVAMALAPVALGALVTAGLFGWLGIAFNTVTLLGLPLVLGLGVDDGIHVAHRLRESRPGRAEGAVASVGTAILLTTATTCASFGTLLFSGHAGLESLARVMLVALPICLLASVSTLPALAAVAGLAGGERGPAAEPVPDQPSRSS